MEINEERRVDTGIVANQQKVYIASPRRGYMMRRSGKETIFARELRQLQDAGYRRVGDYMLPPHWALLRLARVKVMDGMARW